MMNEYQNNFSIGLPTIVCDTETSPNNSQINNKLENQKIIRIVKSPHKVTKKARNQNKSISKSIAVNRHQELQQHILFNYGFNTKDALL